MGQSKPVSQLANKVTPALTDKLYLSDASTTPPTDKYVTVGQIQTVVSPILTTSLSLTSAQILLLNTNPIEIVPAPGAGKVIEVISAFGAITFGTTSYTSNITLVLRNSTTGIADYQGFNTTLLNRTASCNKNFGIGVTGIGDNQSIFIENEPLVITTLTGNPALSNPVLVGGSLKIYMSYRIITL